MQIFLILIILILNIVVIKQWKDIRDLEGKTLEAFRIVCQKIKLQKEDK